MRFLMKTYLRARLPVYNSSNSGRLLSEMSRKLGRSDSNWSNISGSAAACIAAAREVLPQMRIRSGATAGRSPVERADARSSAEAKPPQR